MRTIAYNRTQQFVRRGFVPTSNYQHALDEILPRRFTAAAHLASLCPSFDENRHSEGPICGAKLRQACTKGFSVGQNFAKHALRDFLRDTTSSNVQQHEGANDLPDRPGRLTQCRSPIARSRPWNRRRRRRCQQNSRQTSRTRRTPPEGARRAETGCRRRARRWTTS